MQHQRAARGCCVQRAQPTVVAVLKRSLQAKEPSSQRHSHAQHVVANAYKAVSTTSRPAEPALQQSSRREETSAQPAGQQTDEQLQDHQLFLAKVSCSARVNLAQVCKLGTAEGRLCAPANATA